MLFRGGGGGAEPAAGAAPPGTVAGGAHGRVARTSRPDRVRRAGRSPQYRPRQRRGRDQLRHHDLLRRLHEGRYHQNACFEAGVTFGRAEGILPAPEANHAVKGAIEEALRCKREGKSETILFNLCGHGHFDMQAYSEYFSGKLEDRNYDEQELAMALAGLPSVAV